MNSWDFAQCRFNHDSTLLIFINLSVKYSLSPISLTKPPYKPTIPTSLTHHPQTPHHSQLPSTQHPFLFLHSPTPHYTRLHLPTCTYSTIRPPIHLPTPISNLHPFYTNANHISRLVTLQRFISVEFFPREIIIKKYGNWKQWSDIPVITFA